MFQINAYKLVKSPLVEYSNNLNSSNALKIKVKKNNKNLILRDDITMQIARIATGRLQKKPRPLKLCYYGDVVRKKGSMLRPERQFLQVGAECIGEKSYLADIEMIKLAYEALISVGIKNISIELSSRLTNICPRICRSTKSFCLSFKSVFNNRIVSSQQKRLDCSHCDGKCF